MVTTIHDFAKKHEYPIRAVRYFLETKLTKDEHYYIEKSKTMIPEQTQLLIHKRFKARRDHPISYRRINNEYGYKIDELKDFLKENQDYIMIGKLYYFSKEAYRKIIDKYEGLSRIYQAPRGVTESRSFSEMTKREKEHWANKVRLSPEARDLIFK